MTDELIDIALLVTSVFERLGIVYYIAGSVAGLYYGNIRTTHDIDLIADVKPEHAQAILQNLEKEFYVDAEMILDAVRHHSIFNLLHYGSAFKVDVFVPRQTTSAETRFERRLPTEVRKSPQQIAYLSTPEDLILSKLEWYELGHRTSERQWTDIVNIIKTQSDRLDRAYLNRWAAELGVADLLQKANQDAEI